MAKKKPPLELLGRVVAGLRDGIPQAIVQDEKGEFDDIPQAYLTDISYTGSKNAVVTYNDIDDLIGNGDPAEHTDSEIAQFIYDNWE